MSEESTFDASTLSDEAIIVAFGWFSFGAKATVTSHPPHANMIARQAALDELLAANLITHERETNRRLKIDRHIFRGTWAVMDMFRHPHAKAVLTAALHQRDTDGSPEGRDATRLDGEATTAGAGTASPEVSSPETKPDSRRG